MSNTFCVASYNSVGCTFIDWSVYFLSGQLQHYNVKSEQWLPVSQNPLTRLNAHGHAKNHPNGLALTKKFLEHIESQPSDRLHSIYPSTLLIDSAIQLLNLSPESVNDTHVFADLMEFRKNDYNNILKMCNQKQIKTVFVADNPSTILYFAQERTVPKLSIDSNTEAAWSKQNRDNFQKLFFNQSLEKWKDLNLDNVWDLREQMALNLRPFDLTRIDFVPDQHLSYLWINSVDLWTRTPWVIEKIMKYLQLPFSREKWDQWLPVCLRWQKIQLDILEFCFNQPHIVNAIVNNWDYEIDLTFEQEVIIQHCLIYQHGLNLKTWQLERFPNNTQDLHTLLESNTHQVSY